MDEDASYTKGANGRPSALETRTETEGRQFSPSVSRNRDAVAEAFGRVMPRAGSILEIGSGTGEHGIFLTECFPEVRWFFSDQDDQARQSISAWMLHSESVGLEGPYAIDASLDRWGSEVEALHFDGLFSANVIHIAPFDVAEGIFSGAGRLLHSGGRLFLYGPFARAGEIAESNRNFDVDLKRRDIRWGVRDIERELVSLADRHGLSMVTVIPMPKNNYSVVFEKD
ncbi:MAG: DUF938 domain-containing protein [Pseudomonadota bacterium]